MKSEQLKAFVLKKIDEYSARMRPCPFCGNPVGISLRDNEGNYHCTSYLDDPYSGISFGIFHPEWTDCIFDQGGWASPLWDFDEDNVIDCFEELVNQWNGV